MSLNTVTSTMSVEQDVKAAIFQRLHPRVYFERFVAENVRPDGREFNAWRDVSVNVGAGVYRTIYGTKLTVLQGQYRQQMALRSFV